LAFHMHCSSFEAWLHNIEPNMNDKFTQNLRKKCPKQKKNRNVGSSWKRLRAGKCVFESDQALFGDYRTRWIVEAFAKDQSLFFREFVASMIKLGNVGVIEKGEVRLKCQVVN
jgi:peroxidase